MQNIDLINNSRTAWPSKITMSFLSFSYNLLQDSYTFFFFQNLPTCLSVSIIHICTVCLTDEDPPNSTILNATSTFSIDLRRSLQMTSVHIVLGRPHLFFQDSVDKFEIAHKISLILFWVQFPLNGFTREGQKVLATIYFLFTWVHLYKGGSVYIKYEALSFIPCNMDGVARLVALRH